MPTTVSRLLVLLAVLIASALAVTSVARAGPEFPVNTTTAGDQNFPAIARLANGRFVAVWHGPLGGEDGIDILMQRFTANGRKVGEETRANTFATTGQLFPAVAGLPGGDFVVVWIAVKDASGAGIWGQRFRADGKKIGREFRVSGGAFAARLSPRIAVLADGGFVVVWGRSTTEQATDSEIFGQRFSAEGTKVGKEFRVSKPNGRLSCLPPSSACRTAVSSSFGRNLRRTPTPTPFLGSAFRPPVSR